MNLHDALHHLPEYEPRPDFWARISGELDAEATIDRALLQLPEYKPAAESWETIEARLDTPYLEDMAYQKYGSGRKAGLRFFHTPYLQDMAYGAAACAVLVGGWLWLRSTPTGTIRVAYSVETAPPVKPAVTAPTVNAGQLIARRCREVQTLCEKPEIRELQHELAELETRQADLSQQLAVFGNDPVLLDAQARLELQREAVTKELVQLLAI